jgi:hypothetical protein
MVLVFGTDVASAVKDRVTQLIQGAAVLPVEVGDAEKIPVNLSAQAVVLSFGDTAVGRTLVPAAEVKSVGAEGFVLRSGKSAEATLIASVGNAGDRLPHGNIGTSYGAYALLEELGFAFLHPLAPTLPKKLSLPTGSLDRKESPKWPIRGTHIHTMHPLELTDLLEGWGPNGPDDVAGWTAMLPDWDHYLEWALANRQNRVEWVLLWADSWKDFADGPVRQGRFKQLVDRAHAFGVAAGADVPIGLKQQHGMDLVRATGDLADELTQIHTHLDYVFQAGFDFLATESGSTEFTHPDPTRMLNWMDEVAKYTKATYKAPSYIKAHCSTGQVADGYVDPYTQQPLNFNFLPHYADPSLGVMPHTVEDYGLSDLAPTYGNTDFGYMKDFLEEEVGAREVVWHPETAYWVTFDINVPLFLPIYAERRVSDIRVLAADQAAGKMGRGAHAGQAMDGQMVFSSGWEWGYWLNDVVAARAAWAPQSAAKSDREAFLSALGPVVRPFGAVGPQVATIIADLADAQADLLINGIVNGKAPSQIDMRNGHAYLEGFDATDDLANLAHGAGINAAPVTQPRRLGLVDMRNPFNSGPDYDTELGPLLTAMDTKLTQLSDKLTALAPMIPAEAVDLYSDLVDAAHMTALRAHQVHGLYDYVNGFPFSPADAARLARLKDARDALDLAQTIVNEREKHYRVPADRIAGWRKNPTAYDFTYLWETRSLYFWWRDEGKAVDAPINPCYLNIINPVEVGLGEGVAADAAKWVHDVVGGGAAECLAAPSSEPTFPQDNLRSRP